MYYILSMTMYTTVVSAQSTPSETLGYVGQSSNDFLLPSHTNNTCTSHMLTDSLMEV